MPKKPTKWGMKTWVLADSKSGYTWNWNLYAGKEESASEDSLGTRVVLQLVKDLPPAEYHVYFDNFYTSPGKFHYSTCVHTFTYNFISRLVQAASDSEHWLMWNSQAKPEGSAT